MALRMGGEAPHLGMTLTEGALGAYSVERDLSKSSNDRGCFILHPAPAEILPGGSFKIAWKIFPHSGAEDFYSKLTGRYIRVKARKYVMFLGESNTLRISPTFETNEVLVNDESVYNRNGEYFYHFEEDKLGEQWFNITAGGVTTRCSILVQVNPDALARKRCQFIVQKQQYTGSYAPLKGAYLAYDNEEKHVYYDKNYDYNGGRERVGMGILIARLLQKKPAEYMRRSLDEYTAYVLRELVNAETGEVFNDYGYDNKLLRLYNNSWYATFFTELYRLTGAQEHVLTALRIVKYFYSLGGENFYPIQLPILLLSEALTSAGLDAEKQELELFFRRHADKIAATGTHYPPYEVNFEQSIVAPAADILLQVYLLTGEQKYLEAGTLQVRVLELFNGTQPDYHLNEVAIRHWDGYWFGKRKLYGDTFPHYWSGLTGAVFKLYAQATGEAKWHERADNALRAVLSLIFPDGRASCAYVYPLTVNGQRAGFSDPLANDQDWALYFYLRYIS
jgi:hypothetical protein